MCIASKYIIVCPKRDNRRFLPSEDDIEQTFASGSGTVRLLDLTATVGTAHLSTS